MHWYCLFIDDKPAAAWHRQRRDALHDAMATGAATRLPGSGNRLAWQPSAHIHVCDNAADRNQWLKLADRPTAR